MISRIYPYRMASRSARALSEALGVLRIRPRNSRWVPRAGDVVLNWGNPRNIAWPSVVTWLNSPRQVEIASNKVTSLMAMRAQEVSVPEFTEDREAAKKWLEEGRVVVTRSLLRANSGRGIGLYSLRGDRGSQEIALEELPHVPLYVRYVPKRGEYRIHVFQGQIIDRQQKRLRRGFEEPNHLVRSHHNGWVFCREDLNVPEKVEEEAIKAVQALGLTFGAVDVIWNRYYQEAYVLEVNTAPGLEGTTLERYVEAIRDV